MIPNKVYNDVNQHAHNHIEHHNCNFHADAEGAIKAVMAENKQLKDDKQNLKDQIQLLKDKVALRLTFPPNDHLRYRVKEKMHA